MFKFKAVVEIKWPNDDGTIMRSEATVTSFTRTKVHVILGIYPLNHRATDTTGTPTKAVPKRLVRFENNENTEHDVGE